MIFVLLSCEHYNPNTGKVVLENIDSRPSLDTGYVDIFLKSVLTVVTDSSYIYVSKGFYKNKIVGLRVEVTNNIGAGITDGKMNAHNGFCANGVRITSLGIESNNFLQALAKLYGRPTNKSFSSVPLYASAFSLNETEADLGRNDYYRFKLFFEDNNDKFYGEIFMNVNTESKEIEFFEKDIEFRDQIIHFLAEKR
ncbi:hypothetical protein M1D52_07240 [Olivibacter sp. SA151]|uniref:hypothetical protein n=1 Tax=Olivibacter jilunii TaxID=985016 RepID=UPI003F1483F4